MSDTPNVSVIVVSRDRPESLKLCLTGLSRLLYAPYEIVVVADAAGLDAVRALGLTDEVKTVPFDQANISRARNAGIAEAAGEIIAFIDDDAVPEPAWLNHLVQGFLWPQAAAAGGYVRGRNGITFQWTARSVDRTGSAEQIDLSGQSPVLLTPADGRAIKTEGTNMAFRRSVLAELGGFDPAFRFFLDETDLNMRLMRAGHATAIVPLAEVHHAYAESVRRGPNRAPRDLFEVGASTAAFLIRHASQSEGDTALTRLRKSQRKALLDYMVDGRLEPRDVGRLMRRLEAGIAEGRTRATEPMPPIPHAARWFLAFDSRCTGRHHVLSGRFLFRRRHRAAARQAAKAGDIVSLFLISRTALGHKVRFDLHGVWEQRGGLWGRSGRNERLFTFSRFSKKVQKEAARIRPQRVGVPK